MSSSLIVSLLDVRLLAQSPSESSTSSLEWDLPYTWQDWIPILLLLVAIGTTGWMAMRDRRIVGKGWSAWLAALRLTVLVLALVIAFNPHERTQTDSFRDSRVIVLVDTSQSMQQPESDPRDPGQPVRSRSAAVRELLEKSPLLEELRAQHTIDVYTFDSDLSDLKGRIPSRFRSGNDAVSSAESNKNDSSEEPSTIDWSEIVEPVGLTTRLGDSLDALLIEAKSPTLSGVLVLSDGASNAGRDIQVPRDRAREQGTRLVAVGVGSTTPPINLEVNRMIVPTDVQKGDGFELTAMIRAVGLSAGRTVEVELLQKGPEDPDATVVFRKEDVLNDEGTPLEVQFDLKPPGAGDYEYTVRARIPGVVETREDDNQLSRSVRIFDRPMRILIIAGGPSRDYRYARTILYRHPSMKTDVWLQSSPPGINQEADQVIYRFPETVESLYEYDVIMAFDPDWSLLTPEQRKMLTDWVSNEGGGLLTVAGEVYTPGLATNPDLEQIRKLYPVLLEEISLRLNSRDVAQTPFPLLFTQEGQVADFLKISDDDDTAWSQFPGVCLAYPTRGPKAGTTVYAEFSDPLSRGAAGQPIIFAGQRYGQGQILYVGTPELWRLRAVDPAYLERLWVKSVRKVAEGRSKRGLQRGMFILDGREFTLGQTVSLRLRALNPQFQPLDTDTVAIDVFRQGGIPVTPSPQLHRDPLRPSEFTGDFRPLVPGRYRLEFNLPDSPEKVTAEIDVMLPKQEAASLVQDSSLLRRLVEGTNGEYVSLEEAASVIPSLFPNRGERVIIDQRIRELWDRSWMLYVLGTLLAVEWLTRKLLKLA